MNGECLDKWTNHDAEDEHKPGEKEQKDILSLQRLPPATTMWTDFKQLRSQRVYCCSY